MLKNSPTPNDTGVLELTQKLISEGSLDKLIDILNDKLCENPFDEESLFCTGLAYGALGKHEDALNAIKISNYQELQPGIYWNSLGECLLFLGKTELALQSLKQAIKLEPNFIKPYINLVLNYLNKRKYTEALNVLQEWIKFEPNGAEVNFYLAYTIHRITLNPLAVDPYIDQALKVDHSKRSLALSLAFLNAEAKNDHFKKKQIVNQLMHSFPNYNYTWIYQAHIITGDGDINKSLEYFKKAISLNPRDDISHSKLIMVSHYTNKVSSQDILGYAQNYYEQSVVPFLANNPIHFDFTKLGFSFKQNNSKLRVGFVSADFKLHPVFFWVNALLENTPEHDFEIYVYVNNSKNHFAESLKCHSRAYIHNLSDLELAQKIYKDKIHVLIDLSGHTAGHRLNTFALKPAPLQITWLGHPGPQGLPEIDYMIADKYLVKDGEESLFTEKIYRMSKSFAPYPAAAYSNLHINYSLARTDNIIVFGSINHARKISNEVFETWCEVLQQVNNSVIIINNGATSDDQYKRRIIQLFKSYDIEDSRIIFKSPSTKDNYLLGFQEIDIALDPFPYGGGTTTHETLMMSVPLIALTGNKIATRISSSILEIAGFPELIAETKEEYIDKLVKLAQNPKQIITYKKNIREQYLCSSATDMKSFSSEFFFTLRELFKRKIKMLENA